MYAMRQWNLGNSEGLRHMAKHKQEEAIHPDGWSRWVYPVMQNYKMTCCDCGLVHDVEFRVTDEYDRVEFRVRRNNRSTAQVRRHDKS